MSATSFCSGSRSTTGYGVSGSNSLEFAPSMPTTWRANSATAICMPRHTPRNGMPCSRAIRAAAILPSIPRSPKPPGIRIPSARSIRSRTSSSRIVSESTQSISTPQPCSKPEWRSASTTDR